MEGLAPAEGCEARYGRISFAGLVTGILLSAEIALERSADEIAARK